MNVEFALQWPRQRRERLMIARLRGGQSCQFFIGSGRGLKFHGLISSEVRAEAERIASTLAPLSVRYCLALTCEHAVGANFAQVLHPRLLVQAVAHVLLEGVERRDIRQRVAVVVE